MASKAMPSFCQWSEMGWISWVRSWKVKPENPPVWVDSTAVGDHTSFHPHGGDDGQGHGEGALPQAGDILNGNNALHGEQFLLVWTGRGPSVPMGGLGRHWI